MLDIFFRISFLYLIYRGWKKGFLGSILWPVALIISFVASYSYYHTSKNMLNAIGVSILGPFVITFLASLLLKVWNKTVNDDSLSIVSRISGSIFSLFWSGSYIIALLLLITKVPSNAGMLKNVQDNIRSSQTYSLIAKFMPSSAVDSNNVMHAFANPKTFDKINQSEEFQKLLNNETFKEIMEDKKVQELIKKKDIAGLLANPKMQLILQDKELLKELVNANKKIMKQAADNTNADVTENPKPYVLDIAPSEKQ